MFSGALKYAFVGIALVGWLVSGCRSFGGLRKVTNVKPSHPHGDCRKYAQPRPPTSARGYVLRLIRE